MPNISWTDPTAGQNPWDTTLNAVLDTFGNAINATVGTATPQALGSASAGTQTGPAAAVNHVHPTTGLVATSRQVSAGTGLSGGGDLSADRTLSVSFGSTGSTVAAGNHTHTVPFQVTFAREGTLATFTGASRIYADAAWTITGVRASVGTAPTGSSVICDVKKNGTSIFATTTANRPTIATSANTALSGAPDTTSLTSGDYLTVDCLQTDSNAIAANLTVQILLTRATT